jgi:hypothetical protein
MSSVVRNPSIEILNFGLKIQKKKLNNYIIPRSRNRLEKLIVSQLVKKLPRNYKNRMFIIVLNLKWYLPCIFK